MSDITADVCVIGGGLHGCSAALHLARRGKRVVVIETHYPGRFASGVNAGGVRRLSRDLAEIPLAEASLEIWNNIRALVDDDCDFHACGQLKIAESEEDMAKLDAGGDAADTAAGDEAAKALGGASIFKAAEGGAEEDDDDDDEEAQ